MLNVALTTLLAVLQPAAPQPGPAGQPCTAREMVGTWQFTGKSGAPGVATVLKHITPTHFFVARLAPNDVVVSGLGGTIAVASGTYTETLRHGFGAPVEEMEKYRGMSVAFQCRLDGDLLHLVGQLQDRKLDERWRRVSGPTSP